MRTENIHTTRESWLRAATNELRPYFLKLGYTLPEKIRFAIAFTSTGKRGRIPGECWSYVTSEDQHYEIIIRADISDPMEVLGWLVRELIQTLLPPSDKRGKLFRAIASRVGLEGRMHQTKPSALLLDYLATIAKRLGALPHAKLHFTGTSDAPKKQRSRMLKAECTASCGYTIRLAAKWAKAGLPACPINQKHGLLVCDMPEDESDGEETNPASMNAGQKRKSELQGFLESELRDREL